MVSQQLRRIAGLELPVTVEPLPGDDGRARLADQGQVRGRGPTAGPGCTGTGRTRSCPISDCLIAHPLVTAAGVTRTTLARRPLGGGRRGACHRRAAGDGVGPTATRRGHLTQRAAGRDWRVSAAGFWQVHPDAADVLASAVLAALEPQPGEIALDLFCGAGLFAGVLAEAVGPDGAVVAVEQDAAAVRDARHNLAATPWARVHRGDAAEVLARIGLGGAADRRARPAAYRRGPAADRRAVRSGRTLRRVAYVSCDPATLARDIARLRPARLAA